VLIFIFSSFSRTSFGSHRNSRILLYMLIIWILTAIALSLFIMLASIMTPCSVNAIGAYLIDSQLEVPIWLLKYSNSFKVSSYIKSFQKLLISMHLVFLLPFTFYHQINYGKSHLFHFSLMTYNRNYRN